MNIGSAAQGDQMQLLVLRLAARLAVTLQDQKLMVVDRKNFGNPVFGIFQRVDIFLDVA